MHKHVIVIYPHPDDESFGSSGTMTQFRNQGVPVTYLCGTLGEMGRNMGNPFFANRETLPDIRKKELLDACKILDVNVEMLGYRDKTIEFESRDEIAEHLKGYLEDIKPTLVITHYPGHAVHPDHDAMGAAAVEAVRKMDPEDRPEVWAQAITNDRYETLGKPDIVNNVEAEFDVKVAAIQAHRSQFEGMFQKMRQSPDFKGQYEDVMERFKHEEFYQWQFNN
ncbi:bacillithiol biosynthesis deacetylase BshB2 [Salinibacillus xinjiangensis]|uniref:Bacillithiol biosynthesis deacetylase BshB2 n=1 Tax=Salinibacillus xinjiangensis TaxID=1229268 RepID=A0A6G1X179_9BACI|nr:bacillithiol biosynthesis deacetylase BshB2 [Salinibacillus xinjiangensis]MRG84747.1 bacillithiol biosynthesis deacetylase BshB2 [Salinibacillus xinjiangensis]